MDVALDCIGIPATVQQALRATWPGVRGLRPRGTAVLVGVPQTPVELDMRFLLLGERTYYMLPR